MAIANRTCVSFCNQPKAHYLAHESRRYVVAFHFAAAGIWLRQESLMPRFVHQRNTQLVARNKQHVARNLLSVTCCAGVNAA